MGISVSPPATNPPKLSDFQWVDGATFIEEQLIIRDGFEFKLNKENYMFFKGANNRFQDTPNATITQTFICQF